MKYFREEENPTARLPRNFIQGFLEVDFIVERKHAALANGLAGTELTLCLGHFGLLLLYVGAPNS